MKEAERGERRDERGERRDLRDLRDLTIFFHRTYIMPIRVKVRVRVTIFFHRTYIMPNFIMRSAVIVSVRLAHLLKEYVFV